jgi:beta-glucosidase
MPADILPYRNAALPAEQRVQDLLGRMTLAEKIDQLHQCGAGDTNPNNLPLLGDQFRPTYGSFILNGAQPDLALRDALQRRCVEDSRLGIPAIFGADVIHGYQTIFPIPIAQACSWNPELVCQACAAAAAEAQAQGVDWTFAPMVDIAVDARWGRVAETFGESPYGASIFCEASIRGYQGAGPGAPPVLAACLKHFAGYGESEGGRDYSYTDISPQRLWEMHLPPFAAGVRAGARAVMSAFNDLNGVPASANRHLLTEILRDRWGFEGLVVSDWNAVRQLIDQGFAADEAEATQKAINAGVDLDMADGLYRRHLGALMEQGKVSPGTVDAAVARILRVKTDLGLFEHPLRRSVRGEPLPPDRNYLELAEELAAQSMVLLKNRGDILPVAGRVHRVAMIGPLAEEKTALLGAWSQQGRAEEVVSLLDGMREKLSAGVELRAAQGCTIDGGGCEGFAAAVALARDSDLVLLCLGESARMSGENASRSSLRLPGRQEALALAVAATGKPVVLIIASGRPVELQALEPEMAAMLAIWQPGIRGGAAVADLLLGRRNPSGRLSVTWPRTTGQIPIYHNMRPRARGSPDGEYQDLETTPLFEFGHGMSYTTFAYSPIRLAGVTASAHETLLAEVTVTNAGPHDGSETVLWFIRDPVASITRPLKELKHFERAIIAAGASRAFRFEINPARDLSFPDADGRMILESGEIMLLAGPQRARFRVVI